MAALTARPSTEYRDEYSDDILAVCVSAFIAALALLSKDTFHWFMIPTTFCGALIGGDAIKWVRGRVDVFDPMGIIGLVGYYFFFLAPILHTVLDFWMPDVDPPPDWRVWVGKMAILNTLGIMAYRIGRRRVGGATHVATGYWLLDSARFYRNASILLLASLLLQLWVYRRFNGIGGYIQSFEESPSSFEGLGIVFVFSESFPIILLLVYAVWAKKNLGRPSWFHLATVVVCFCIILLFFGGLRGSRSHTINAAFWAVGICHVWLRPLPRKAVVVALGVGLVFAYAFGFYKGAGLRGLAAATDPASRTILERETGRTVSTLLLGDLSRSAVQAYLLYRLDSNPDYRYAWGRTYLGAAALLIPRSVASDRPPTKVMEGTQLQYGVGKYDPGRFVTTRVYGLAGEALLNFGPLAIVPMYWLFGKIVGRMRRLQGQWAIDDSRLLLAPLTVLLCYAVLTGDSDNVIVLIIQYLALPFLLLRASSVRVRTSSSGGVAHTFQ